MNKVRVTTKTGTIPTAKNPPKKRGLIPANPELKSVVRSVLNGNTDYAQTAPIDDPYARRLMRGRFTTVATNMGRGKELSTHTTEDNRVVAYRRKVKAVS